MVENGLHGEACFELFKPFPKIMALYRTCPGWEQTPSEPAQIEMRERATADLHQPPAQAVASVCRRPPGCGADGFKRSNPGHFERCCGKIHQMRCSSLAKWSNGRVRGGSGILTSRRSVRPPWAFCAQAWSGATAHAPATCPFGRLPPAIPQAVPLPLISCPLPPGPVRHTAALRVLGVEWGSVAR